jgi:RimJ/RimL family protein N-acetyltransferase
LIFKPTLADVTYVATNMRAVDAEEIYPLRFDKTPEGLAHTVMSSPVYVWAAAPPGGAPAAVFGVYEVRPRAWTAFAFGTDNFNTVAGGVTKFLLRKVKPHLFHDLGAQRVEAWSHGNHVQAHRWLTALGAKPEPDPEYGPEGETYVRFVARRSDWLLSQAAKPPTIFAYLGRTPDLASPEDSITVEHVHP